MDKDKYFVWRGKNRYFEPPLELFMEVLEKEGTYKGAAKWFGIDRHTASSFARKNNLNSPFEDGKYYLSDKEEEYIKSMYNERTAKSLSEEIGCSEPLIAKVWREAGLRGKSPYSYYYDKDYFEEIDTAPKAYYLGFILGDGCVHQNSNGQQKTINIAIHSQDEHILDSFREEIGTKKPLYRNTKKGTVYVTLQISSDKMANDLLKYGVKERKSVEPSEIKNIPEEFENDFMRGFFDADGSVYRGRADTQRFTVALNGNRDVIKYFENLLSKNKVRFSTYQDTHKDYTVDHYHLKVMAINHVHKFMDLIYYEDTKHKLIRKRDIFSQFEEVRID